MTSNPLFENKDIKNIILHCMRTHDDEYLIYIKNKFEGGKLSERKGLLL